MKGWSTVAWLLLCGCATVHIAPVRPGLFVERAREPEARSPMRFADTVVERSRQGAESAAELLELTSRALQAANYPRAREYLGRLQRVAGVSDSIRAEAQFLHAELAAAQGELRDAQQGYERLLEQPIAPALRERVLLRYGHVLCAQGRSTAAAQVFEQLRRQFPTSRYLPLASCAAVK